MAEKILLFYHDIIASGGGQRLFLEEERNFTKMGITTHIITYSFDRSIFNSYYNPSVILIPASGKAKNRFVKILYKIVNLRKTIRDLRPDHILSNGELECVYLYFATLFSRYRYSTHIHQNLFWNVQTYADDLDGNNVVLGRYSTIFKRVYHEIRNSSQGHLESLPDVPPSLSVKTRVFSEIIRLLTYLSVRKAKNIFVLSDKMGWEVGKMYRRSVIKLKGAFSKEIFSYQPKVNVRQTLGIGKKKIIFSLCRLEPKKRVDIIIKAFHILLKSNDNVVLVVGGTGSSFDELKMLVERLGIHDRVHMVGFIEEAALNDYYYYCDLFVSADYADYDITTYTALGFNKVNVWADDNETEEAMIRENMVFLAKSTPSDFAKTMDHALHFQGNPNYDASIYSWEKYCALVYKHLQTSNAQ